MLESLRKIGMIEMPKIKHTAKRSIDELARKEAMRLLKRELNKVSRTHRKPHLVRAKINSMGYSVVVKP